MNDNEQYSTVSVYRVCKSVSLENVRSLYAEHWPKGLESNVVLLLMLSMTLD